MTAEKRPPRLKAHDLEGTPGLSRAARDALLAQQPTRVLEALRQRGGGRKTTGRLLALGCLVDPEGVQERPLTGKEMGIFR